MPHSNDASFPGQLEIGIGAGGWMPPGLDEDKRFPSCMTGIGRKELTADLEKEVV